MNNKIKLAVLFEALMILGHGRVWMEETEFDHFPGYDCYREIKTWDNRTVAWWDDADDTWKLCEEIDVITPVPTYIPEKEGELLEDWRFNLMVLGNC